MKSMHIVTSLIAGSLFGFGLALSGMMDPAIVKAFLNPFGEWNAALAFVMAGAIGVTAPAYFFILKRDEPFFDNTFHVTHLKDIDSKLIIGAALFGIGWGFYGLCPGPALAQVFSLQVEIFVFAAAMLAGMHVSQKLSDKF